jgi:hypothetical protein
MKQHRIRPYTLRFALALAVFACGITGAAPLHASTATLTLTPTRVVLEGTERYATITVKNSGDGIGRYRIELIDATMQENGGVKLLESGQRDPYSALDNLSISPRTMTLKPGDFQTIRLLVKNPGVLKDGEYRSHLKVKMTENDINEVTGKPNGDAVGVTIKPKLSLVIPIIVRRGKLNYAVDITDARLVAPALDGGKQQMEMDFAMKGNRSVMGDVKIAQLEGGKEKQLLWFPGVAIYRGTPKRSLLVALDEKPDAGGKILVTFSTQDKEPKVIAKKEFTP